MKKYALTVFRKSGYLHIRVTGTNSLETVRSYLMEVHAACLRRKARAVLIEEHLKGPGLGVLDIFSVVSARLEEDPPKLNYIAYVDTHPAHQPALMQFMENVAVNRGVNVRVFPNVRKAQAWLVASLKAEG